MSDFTESIDELAQMFMQQRKFNPLEYRKLYFLYSKKVDEEIKIEIDAAYHVYFTSDSHKQDFRIHQLEFGDTGEWMYWHARGIRGDKARIKGIRTFTGTFYGNIRTDDRTLEIIAKDLRVLELRGERKRFEDNKLLYGMMISPIKSIYPESEKMLLK